MYLSENPKQLGFVHTSSIECRHIDLYQYSLEDVDKQ